MTEIRLHDTMAREKRAFVPADPRRVTMYVCGPTVYNRAHIGNARPYVVFDVLGRLLRHVYGADSLVYARNFTDVDDKIIDAARNEGVDPAIVTDRYEKLFLDDMGALGVLPTTMMPRATEHIAEMIAMIARLVEAGHAYEADGHVLFDVPSDPDYGALGRRDRDAMIAGARVEVASYKKDPADFVLWKPSEPAVIGWESPWGRGRPGWHIECSAMIERHLGETIDIHAGGLDLIFPHHENEIAQSRCAHGGAPLARYWLHNGFLSMAGSEKMSKSLGNVVTVGELLKQDSRGEIYRLALLSAHYRQPLEWSDDLLETAKELADRYFRALKVYDGEEREPPDDFVESLSDDLQTGLALQSLGSQAKAVLRFVEQAHASVDDDESSNYGRNMAYAQQAAACLAASGRLLGLSTNADAWFRPIAYILKTGTVELQLTGSDAEFHIKKLVQARSEAKARRDFSAADLIRSELADQGIILEDRPDGTTDWRRA